MNSSQLTVKLHHHFGHFNVKYTIFVAKKIKTFSQTHNIAILCDNNNNYLHMHQKIFKVIKIPQMFVIKSHKKTQKKKKKKISMPILRLKKGGKFF